MNPLQQMELTRFDHQERLQQSQRNAFARKPNRKSFFKFSFLDLRKSGQNHNKPANVSRDAVAVN